MRDAVRGRLVTDTAHVVLVYGVPLACFLLAWQVWSSFFGVPALFPPPLTTFGTLVGLVADGTLPKDVGASVTRIVVGFVVGSAIGAFLGLLMGSSRLVRYVLDPYVNFLRFISGVAWISIFIVWFGIGEASKVVLIVYTTVFAVLLNTLAGVTAVSSTKLRAARCFGASSRQVFFLVTLPATVRYIITGMRLSLANSFLTIVAAEMVQADNGIGFMIIAARQFLAPDVIFSGMIVLGLLGLLSDRLLMGMARVCLGRYWRGA